MTLDEIRTMAERAGILKYTVTLQECHRFAEIVSAETRKKCAQICDTKAAEFEKDSEEYDCQEDQSYKSRQWGAEECAEAIRSST